ncbi:MAG: hypothetical protein CSA05_03325 [Bacteroidia bacterium]|nr:MAG: hypothetical protein CSA05_03325 [Bacteroidia bacterium]
MNFTTQTKIIGCILFIVFCGISLQSQHLPKEYQIQYFDTIVELPSNAGFFSRRTHSFKSSLYNKQYYVIIQFYELPNKITMERLDKLGIDLLKYIPNMAFIASFPKNKIRKKLKKIKIRSLYSIPPEIKIHHSLKSGVFSSSSGKDTIVDVNIHFYKGLDEEVLKNELRDFNVKKISILKTYNKFRVRILQSRLPELAQLAWVEFIEPGKPPKVKKNVEK